MKASVQNPIYTVNIQIGDWVYTVTNALISINISDQEKQIAVCASIELFDVETAKGPKLSSLIAPPNLVRIFAKDGEKSDEVFRGFVWEVSPKEGLTDAALTIKCYDQLIYWQESEDSDFFSAGKNTKDVIKSIADRWGISFLYEYDYIIHEKLVLRGAIADFITADVLDAVQKQCGVRYVIRSEKEKVVIRPVGCNDVIYKFTEHSNITELSRYLTMNGVITQVIVLGTTDDDDKTPIEATVTGNTKNYGTLQKIITRDQDATLAVAKKEAQTIIDESGKPKWEYDLKAPDIPWIRKGDKVEIKTKTINGYKIVKSVDREISNSGKIMTLTVIDE